MINVLLWAPLVGGLVALLVPARLSGWAAAGGSLAALVAAIAIVCHFEAGNPMIQEGIDKEWIPELGVRFQIGVDGLSVFLVLLTAVLWMAATCWSAFRQPERQRTYFLMFGLAETAALGAFLAQDLILFVLFFDLMLIPFYFLFGSWGEDAEDENGDVITARAATIKMIVYTLIGSLLMLVGAIATGVLGADGGSISFSMLDLKESSPLGEGSQDWIFWCFAAAFLVKMPAFPLHGWMPDAYRVAPLPALAVFSAVLSKVGAYGFLQIVLPIFPDAAGRFQEVVLVVAVVSVIYGSLMAFTQTNARLVAGYSSVAQLGFITLGIFSFRADGADGALLQMVNHGIVIAPLMLVFVLLIERAKSDDIREMGGLAMKAPVLAAMTLILTMALLAMPGSANFIGEFYILNGVFESKIAFAFIAALGIAFAAYYALRLFQHAFHNRVGDGVKSKEIGVRDGAIVGALVACVVALALYPQVVLERVDFAANDAASAVPERQCENENPGRKAYLDCIADLDLPSESAEQKLAEWRNEQ